MNDFIKSHDRALSLDRGKSAIRSFLENSDSEPTAPVATRGRAASLDLYCDYPLEDNDCSFCSMPMLIDSYPDERMCQGGLTHRQAVATILAVNHSAYCFFRAQQGRGNLRNIDHRRALQLHGLERRPKVFDAVAIAAGSAGDDVCLDFEGLEEDGCWDLEGSEEDDGDAEGGRW